MEPIVFWDLENDPDGNVAHPGEDSVTREDVEEVLRNEDNETDGDALRGQADFQKLVAAVEANAEMK